VELAASSEGARMRTVDPSQSPAPFEDQPTQPLAPGESFGPPAAMGGPTFYPISGAIQPGMPQPPPAYPWTNAGTSPAYPAQMLPPAPLPARGAAGAIARPSGTQKRRGGSRISRRTLLIGAGIAGVGGVAAAAGLTIHHLASPSSSSGSSSSAAQVGHLLRRAGFGVAPGDLAIYEPLGVEGAADRLLNFQHIPNTVMDQKIAAANFNFSTIQDQQRWWLTRMVYSAHPLEEKMTLFWHGLLTSSYRKVGGKQGFPLIQQQNDFLRKNAFARFDDLLAGITIDPAMLIWLDGLNSRKGSPNENFAREEMELFSMGVGNYTQQDIEQSARALTGWTINRQTLQAVFRPLLHDDGTKTFLGQTGNFDYKDIARIIAANPATPKFLARRLWRFFAYENPADADLQPLIAAYNSSNHNIGAMMRALLTSPAFYSSQAYRARLKSPVEFLVGAFRNLGLPGLEQANRGLLGALIIMGQELFDPPNVAGWPGDQSSAAWINTGAWMTRVNVVNALVGAIANAPAFVLRLQSDVQRQHIDTPSKFVDYVLLQLVDGQIDSARHQMLVEYLTSNTTAGGGTLRLTGGQNLSGNSVRELYYLVMSMPEYQLN
jgi:uncharacterized protein (DUF1800 family)